MSSQIKSRMNEVQLNYLQLHVDAVTRFQLVRGEAIVAVKGELRSKKFETMRDV